MHVVEIVEPEGYDVAKMRAHADATFGAMQQAADLIYQGAFFDGTWYGKPDFLHKIEGQSRFGNYAHEIVDAKLARTAGRPLPLS